MALSTLIFCLFDHTAQVALSFSIQLVQEHFEVFFILALDLEPLVFQHFIEGCQFVLFTVFVRLAVADFLRLVFVRALIPAISAFFLI